MFGDLMSCLASNAGHSIQCRTPANLVMIHGIVQKVTQQIVGAAWHWMKCGVLLTSRPHQPSRTSSVSGTVATIFLPIVLLPWTLEPARGFGISKKFVMIFGTWIFPRPQLLPPLPTMECGWMLSLYRRRLATHFYWIV